MNELEQPHSSEETGAPVVPTTVFRPIATLSNTDPELAEIAAELLPNTSPKLGTFLGVTVPTCEFMWSVLLFIRFGWFVGDAGLLCATAVILVSALSACLTASSVSAIASNGAPTAGIHHIFVKSLGRGMGSSIACLMYFGVTLLTSVEIVGAVSGLLRAFGMSSYRNQVGLSLLSVCLCSGLVLFGRSVVHRVASFFLVCLLLSFGALILGLVINGGVGQSLGDILGPSGELNFSKWFALIVPCYIGILTGINNATRLESPHISIPRGMFSSLGISTVLYLLLILLFSFSVSRKILLNDDIIGLELAWPSKYIAFAGVYVVGFGASLQCLQMASSVLHSLAQDEIIPLRKLPLLGPVTNDQETTISILFTTLVLLVLVTSEDLDMLVGITAMCFLLSDAATNFICLVLNEFKSPNWRPKFKFNNRWMSCAGMFLCFVLMFSIQWYSALGSVLAFAILAYLIQTSSSSLSWGQGMHGLMFHLMVRYLVAVEQDDFLRRLNRYYDEIYRLRNRESYGIVTDVPSSTVSALSTHHKRIYGRVWRPQIVCFVKMSLQGEIIQPRMIAFLSQLRSRSALCILVNVLAKDSELARIESFLIRKKEWENKLPSSSIPFANPIRKHSHSHALTGRERKELIDESLLERKLKLQKCMEEHEVLGFAKVLSAPSVRTGQRIFLQTMGLGELTPNTVVIEWPLKNNDLERRETLDHLEEIWLLARRMDLACIICKGTADFPLNREVLSGNIDIWWLVQEGQLLLMIAYLLQQHRVWRHCSIRLFAICHTTDAIEEIEKELEEYLEIMRINVDRIEVIPVELIESAIDLEVLPQTHLRDFALARRMRSELRQVMLGHDESYGSSDDEPGNNRNNSDHSRHHERRNSFLQDSKEAEDQILFANSVLIRRLREVMVHWSMGSSMLIYNLPAPDDTEGSHHGPYMDLIEWLTRGFKRSVLVYAGSSALRTSL